VTEQELRQAYESQKPQLQAWGRFVRDRVLSGLAQAIGPNRKTSEFLKIVAEPRVKDTESFVAKALRRGQIYENPLQQIIDRVGIRFVVLLRSELEFLQQVIEGSEIWDVEKSRNFEAEQIERPHHFDYQSVHYVVRARKAVTVDAGTIVPPGLPCEVQVRTLLQHAYAELAHDTTYKPTVTLERDVSRQLARGSALVETADEIFDVVRDTVEQASADIQRVHALAVDAYARAVGTVGYDDARLSNALFDAYRALLPRISRESLSSFLAQNDFIPDNIRERAPMSLLYAHPSILVIYFLVAESPDEVPKRWPFDLKHLEMIYSDLGISTEDRL
jgi:putative GTP pyrophosphokinase